jgi:hypothetical protein
MFAFKFTLRCLKPDIVSIICHLQLATGIVDTGCKFATGINNTGKTGVKICRLWCNLTSEYLRKFSKKFKTVLMKYSGAVGKLIHQKKTEAKNLVTLSL